MLSLTTLLALALTADTGTFTVEVGKSLPPFQEIALYDAGATKLRAKLESGKPITLPGTGPFDVIATPKDGVPVRVATVKSEARQVLQLADVLGTIEVFADNLPRAAAIVVTATDDPGPGERGHVVILRATDYRVEMVVPDGTYAVWVIPANGARAQKIRDNLRVLAGRSHRIE